MTEEVAGGLETIEKQAKKSRMATMARSKNLLDAYGFIVTEVEQKQRIPGGRMISRDAFGIADILAVYKPTSDTWGAKKTPQNPGTLYVQVTTRDNAADRKKKLALSPHLPVLLLQRNHVCVLSWGQQKEGRATQLRWVPKFEFFGYVFPTAPSHSHELDLLVREATFDRHDGRFRLVPGSEVIVRSGIVLTP